MIINLLLPLVQPEPRNPCHFGPCPFGQVVFMGGSFRPDFIGGTFRPYVRVDSFWSDLFIIQMSSHLRLWQLLQLVNYFVLGKFRLPYISLQ